MTLAHEQDITERYSVISEDSNGAGTNEFVPQFTCLQSRLHVKHQR